LRRPTGVRGRTGVRRRTRVRRPVRRCDRLARWALAGTVVPGRRATVGAGQGGRGAEHEQNGDSEGRREKAPGA
jgi:hypothetical protein